MASYLKESLRQALEAREKRESRRPGGTPGEDPRSGGRERPPVAKQPEHPSLRGKVKRPSGVRLDGARPSPAVRPPPRSAPPPPSAEAPKVPTRAGAAVAVGQPQENLSPLAMAFDRPLIVAPPPTRFQPREPKNLDEAGLDPSFVEGLIVKYLLQQPGSTSRQVAGALALHFTPIRELLDDMKAAKLVVLKRSTATGDFSYQLTEGGRAHARDIQLGSRYVGPAPVPFAQWLTSVSEQSIANEKPKLKDLRRAFQDLLVTDELLQQLGPAVTSGKGLFLFGFPGNGKTSLAERMTRAFGTSVYIPHAVLVEGHLIKIFDPMVHEPLDEPDKTLSSRERVDPRWIKCRRPTVVAGGELTMDSLELEYSADVGICEAPIQVKAACGTLVIDDFGRQRVDPATLLNRWIVPLEQRVDFLRLPDGRKVQVPFDPLLVFSTNLDPKDLCDEAFLRRIPYKVNVVDPDEASFRKLLYIQCELLGFPPNVAAFDHLIDTHYRKTGRPFRNCHPRDLVLQVKNQCLFRETELALTAEAFDEAANLYFTLL